MSRNRNQIQKLSNLLHTSLSPQEKIDALSELAWELRYSAPKQAEANAQKAIELAQAGTFLDQPYKIGLAAGMVAQASVEFQNGLIEAGVEKCLKALNHLEAYPPSKTNARIWYTLSWNSFFLGDYSAAREQALKALNLAKKLELSAEKAWALDVIASAYGISNDIPNAIQAHKEAIQIFHEIKDADGMVRATNNMAMTLYMLQDYPAALESAKQSLEYAHKWDRKYDALNIACTVAQILIDMGELEEADKYLKETFADAEIFENTNIFHVFVFMERARLALKQDNLQKAKSNLFLALKVAEENNQQVERGKCHKSLAEIYEQQGYHQRALEHLKIFLSIHEESVGERAAIRMSILTISHQVESVRKEAQIYRLQAEQLRREMEVEKQTKELFEQLSMIDGLTSVANRRHFDERLAQEYSRHSRTSGELSLIMLDVDHFKLFNDIYGHLRGDECLRQVAQAIKAQISRTTDLVARFGGEEFICILPNTNVQTAVNLAEKIRKAVFDLGIPHAKSTVANKVTVSLGVITAYCHPKGSPLVLIERADQQLYKAKANGRNQISSTSTHTHQLAPKSLNG